MDPASRSGSVDVEKSAYETTQTPVHGESKPILTGWRKLASYGVELRGVQPVALEERTDKHPINLLSFWCTVGLTMLA